MHNGCELSGRESLTRLVFPEPASPISLASAAESPVRSSELLAGQDHSSSHLLSTLGPCCRSHEDRQSNDKKEAA